MCIRDRSRSAGDISAHWAGLMDSVNATEISGSGGEEEVSCLAWCPFALGLSTGESFPDCPEQSTSVSMGWRRGSPVVEASMVSARQGRSQGKIDEGVDSGRAEGESAS